MFWYLSQAFISPSIHFMDMHCNVNVWLMFSIHERVCVVSVLFGGCSVMALAHFED